MKKCGILLSSASKVADISNEETNKMDNKHLSDSDIRQAQASMDELDTARINMYQGKCEWPKEEPTMSNKITNDRIVQIFAKLDDQDGDDMMAYILQLQDASRATIDTYLTESLAEGWYDPAARADWVDRAGATLYCNNFFFPLKISATTVEPLLEKYTPFCFDDVSVHSCVSLFQPSTVARVRARNRPIEIRARATG